MDLPMYTISGEIFFLVVSFFGLLAIARKRKISFKQALKNTLRLPKNITETIKFTKSEVLMELFWGLLIAIFIWHIFLEFVPNNNIIFIVIALLFSPFIEELFYRGMFYQLTVQINFFNNRKWRTFFCVLQAVAFGLIHGGFFIQQMFLGLVLGSYAFSKKGNLLLPIAAHYLINIIIITRTLGLF